MAFDPNRLGMAIFLLVATAFNIWFVITSYRRSFFTPNRASDIKSIVEVEPASRQSYQLLSNASFDIPWVWLCMIQCWNNTFHQNNFQADPSYIHRSVDCIVSLVEYRGTEGHLW